MPDRNCTNCQTPAPLESFPLRKGGKDGRHSWCRKCLKEKQSGYTQKYLSDPVKREKNSAAGKRFRQDHPEEARKKGHETYMRLKRAMLAAYGPNCKCCGEHREAFLTLEHVNRDGKAHRQKEGGGANVYRDLRNRGWPQEGFTVLCINCNFATRFGDPCPHQIERTLG